MITKNCSAFDIKSIAKMIDHSLVHPTFTDSDIIEGCRVAIQYDVASVCLKPHSISLAKSIVAGSSVAICSAIGFPHGSNTTNIKVAEILDAIKLGATEIDTVVNVGKVLSEDWDYVAHEIKLCNKTCINNGAILKVIFETDYLKELHIIKLCEICSGAKVAFVKTSTGYGFVKQEAGYNYCGATVHNVKLMRKHCPSEIKIKAAGGIRTLDDLLKFRALGVSRIGATATKKIIEEAVHRLEGF